MSLESSESTSLGSPEPDPYLAERVRAQLATDQRVGELGLAVRVIPGRLVITGSVPSEECRQAIAEVATEIAGPVPIVNETIVTPAPSPGEHHEVLQ
jgi:osmotically-inducible protein OsmY